MTKSVFSDRYNQLLVAMAQARRGAGITQAQLAMILGKPQSYVSKIERGERRIDVVEFLELVEALGVEPAAILSAWAGENSSIDTNPNI